VQAPINTNGPAIKEGCVTRRKHRADPGTLAAKLSRCKEGVVRVFAVRVQILLSITSVAKVSKRLRISPGIEILSRALARSWYEHSKSILAAGAKVEERSDETPLWQAQNHDELIYFIVRVMVSCFYESLHNLLIFLYSNS
jgi:hypothetical protein